MQNVALPQLLPAYPTCQQFADQIGSSFAVSVSGGALVQLELVHVTPYEQSLDVKDKSLKIQAFSITFSGARAQHLPQNSYTMEHPALGEMNIFIVPIGPDAQGMRYEAVFNFD